MLNLLLIVAVAAAGTAASRFFPTEDLLQDQFALGQNYYAANDHGNAARVFEEIEATPNYALLDVDGIDVTIGELTLPLRQAATYQLANSYRNVGRTQLERAEAAAAEGDSATGEVRRTEARDAFDAAVEHYRRLILDADVDLDLRAMAQYQVVRARYQMGDFAEVVRAVTYLRQSFPGSEYEEDAIYDQGWAQFYTGNYGDAIATFAELLSFTDDALKRDRAVFQTGESHFAEGRYESARVEYRHLVSLYDFSAMTEKELKEMKTERLRGLVQETTRELVAKAQIRIGDSYGEEGDLDAAVEAYSLVPQRYPEEQPLVQRSYENMAALLHEQRGVDAGIAVLRRAIEQVEEPQFRGRAQFRIATLLYREARYDEAIEDLQVYLRAYGDIALQVGAPLDRVHFLIGESQRLLGDRQRAAGQDPTQRYEAALERYRLVLARFSRSPRLAEARFGLALAHYGIGAVDSALVNMGSTASQYPASGVAAFALSWEGRLLAAEARFEEAERAYRQLLADYPASGVVDQTWRDLGLVHKQRGDLPAALDAFAAVSSDSPFWPKVQAEAGDMLLAESRIDLLERQFDVPGALQQSLAAGDVETAAELHYIRGRVARERGDSAAEIDQLTAAIGLSQNSQLSSFCLFFRGLARYRLGAARDAAGDAEAAAIQFGACAEDLELLLDEDATPEMRSVAYRTRGVALTRLGRSAEAVDNYRILIASSASGEERSDYELMLMELYFDLGQLEETAATARQIIAADFDDDNAAGFYKRERAYLVLTSVLLEREEYKQTVETASRAIAAYPGSAELATLRLAIARALFSAQDYTAAAAAFDEYVERHGDHFEAVSGYYQLGYAHELLGSYDRAAAAFGRLAELFPEQQVAPEALYRSAENQYNASRFEEALVTYGQVVERYPAAEAAEKSMYSAAWTYMDLEREADSMAAMARLVEAYPESRFARLAQFTLGDYAYSQKRHEDAREAYRRVVAMFPGTPEADKAEALIADLTEDIASLAYEAAFADLDEGRYVTAVEGFEAVYRAYPETYSGLAALANKGVALEKLGDNRQALVAYEKVIDLTSANPEAEAIAEFVRLRMANL